MFLSSCTWDNNLKPKPFDDKTVTDIAINIGDGKIFMDTKNILHRKEFEN